jgi:hypothetical protein
MKNFPLVPRTSSIPHKIVDAFEHSHPERSKMKILCIGIEIIPSLKELLPESFFVGIEMNSELFKQVSQLLRKKNSKNLFLDKVKSYTGFIAGETRNPNSKNPYNMVLVQYDKIPWGDKKVREVFWENCLLPLEPGGQLIFFSQAESDPEAQKHQEHAGIIKTFYESRGKDYMLNSSLLQFGRFPQTMLIMDKY